MDDKRCRETKTERERETGIGIGCVNHGSAHSLADLALVVAHQQEVTKLLHHLQRCVDILRRVSSAQTETHTREQELRSGIARHHDSHLRSKYHGRELLDRVITSELISLTLNVRSSQVPYGPEQASGSECRSSLARRESHHLRSPRSQGSRGPCGNAPHCEPGCRF